MGIVRHEATPENSCVSEKRQQVWGKEKRPQRASRVGQAFLRNHTQSEQKAAMDDSGEKFYRKRK